MRATETKASPARRNTNFVHPDCEYYPCHPHTDGEWHSCLFCFCPLYLLDCPGAYMRLPSGMKDCSACMLPHREDGREIILTEIREQLFA